jgi:hypothetical protein
LSITVEERTAEVILGGTSDKKTPSTLKGCKVVTEEKDLPAYLKPAPENAKEAGKQGANEPIPLKSFVQCQESQDSEFGVLLLDPGANSEGPANAAAFEQGVFAVALACEEKIKTTDQ